MKRNFILIFLSIFLLPNFANAQEGLQFENVPKEVTFAQPFTLSVTLPEPATLDKDTSQESFEITGVHQTQGNPLEITLDIVPFNLGISTLTAVSFVTQGGQTLETRPLEIDIKAAQTNIKGDGLIDIRGPYRPFNFWLFLWVLLFVVAAIYGVIHYKKRRTLPKTVNLSPYVNSVRPMHEIALEQLNILMMSELWLNKEYKVFYSEMSDILRGFLSARFNFDANKLTSRELLKKLKTVKDFKFDLSDFKKFQQDLIYVKFAKVLPTEEQRDSDIKTAREIIISNKEPEIITPKDEGKK